MVHEKKELEPHLIRVPFDPNAAPKAAKTFVDTKGMTVAQKKAANEAAAKAEAEAVKLKKIKRSLTILFTEIKQLLDQKVEPTDYIHDKIQLEAGMLRYQLNNKKFISLLYSGFSANQDTTAGKSELIQFIKCFVPKMAESEIYEILSAHRKKQGLNQTNDSFTSSDMRMDMTLLDP
jgi:flagellar biosynthesis chaperone FliJ